MRSDKRRLYKKAKSIIGDKTPLKKDCGLICGGACCKGDSNTGMLLFPGEEKLIDPDINVIETENGDKLAVCNGSCDRNHRPLSCRIYPLFPVVTDEGDVKVCFDYRADCPLSTNNDYEFNKRFIKAVKRVGKYLLINEETKEFYLELSDACNEYYELLKKLK